MMMMDDDDDDHYHHYQVYVKLTVTVWRFIAAIWTLYSAIAVHITS